MNTLLALFLSLLPCVAFAQSSEQFPFKHSEPQRGWHAAPSTQGGVDYFRAPGGTDAYHAGIIGQGLSQLSRPAPSPIYQSPPIVIDIPYSYRDPIREANDRFLEHR